FKRDRCLRKIQSAYEKLQQDSDVPVTNTEADKQKSLVAEQTPKTVWQCGVPGNEMLYEIEQVIFGEYEGVRFIECAKQMVYDRGIGRYSHIQFPIFALFTLVMIPVS